MRDCPNYIFTAVHALTALIWAIVAADGLRVRRQRRLTGRLFQLIPILGVSTSFVYVLSTVLTLIPPEFHFRHARALVPLYGAGDVSSLASIALFRHMSRYFGVRELPPGRAWLAVNYGSAALVAALSCAMILLATTADFDAIYYGYHLVYFGYLIAMLVASGYTIRGLARPHRAWLPGGLGVASRLDLILLGTGVLAIAAMVAVFVTGGWATHGAWMQGTGAAVGFLLALPFATRTLGDVVRGVTIAVVLFATAAGVYFGVHHVAAALPAAWMGRIVELAALAALVVIAVPGQTWLRNGIDRFALGRSRQRADALHACLQSLSPELGAVECCRRALAELARVMQLRGAAIVLHDGEGVALGEFDLAPLERVWPRGVAADALGRRSLVAYELRELPGALTDALVALDVVQVATIASAGRVRGHLFVRTDLLGVTFDDDDVTVVEGFADQLARLLDGVDLLARALAVERALAHREKLAAIGELAARVAHEIRNPVTAARSLAQQLARSPATPADAESATLILAELERVERQVAALLRFARRDDFRFEPVELGALVQATVESFRPRAEDAAVELSVDANRAVTVRADRDKLRQVLVNLIENSLDALAATAGARRLRLVVGGVNGSATVRVTDSGPGVPADALPHLFEPFFSLKEHGTGLGLAIVKRTVDAHGGRIEATPGRAGGMTFAIELPLGGPA